MVDYENEAKNDASEAQIDQIDRQSLSDIDDEIVQNDTQLRKKMLDRKNVNLVKDVMDLKDILLSNLGATESNTVFLMVNQLYFTKGLGFKTLSQECAIDLGTYLATKSAIGGQYAKMIATKSREITRKTASNPLHP